MANISKIGNELVCNNPSCKLKAISLSENCWKHTNDKISYIEKLKKYLLSGESGENFILQKIVLRDSDLIRVNLKGADLTQSDLTNTNFSYSDFSSANLIGSNLQGCDLTGSNLKSCDLTRANMKSVRLWHADLSHANIAEADLNESDLWNCQLYESRLWHTGLKNIKSLTKQNFSKTILGFISREKIDEKGVMSAQESYLALKQYFIENGRYREASWASFKE
ncbi:MAG: pentapeptide repeat-containing protein, partial [Candidatus Omnitrophica bacterium]|nr:pentapeptide repeat-containing protein [Candidatus Omnitrophota bacterium]